MYIIVKPVDPSFHSESKTVDKKKNVFINIGTREKLYYLIGSCGDEER